MIVPEASSTRRSRRPPRGHRTGCRRTGRACERRARQPATRPRSRRARGQALCVVKEKDLGHAGSLAQWDISKHGDKRPSRRRLRDLVTRNVRAATVRARGRPARRARRASRERARPSREVDAAARRVTLVSHLVEPAGRDPRARCRSRRWCRPRRPHGGLHPQHHVVRLPRTPPDPEGKGPSTVYGRQRSGASARSQTRSGLRPPA